MHDLFYAWCIHACMSWFMHSLCMHKWFVLCVCECGHLSSSSCMHLRQFFSQLLFWGSGTWHLYSNSVSSYNIDQLVFFKFLDILKSPWRISCCHLDETSAASLVGTERSEGGGRCSTSAASLVGTERSEGGERTSSRVESRQRQRRCRDYGVNPRTPSWIITVNPRTPSWPPVDKTFDIETNHGKSSRTIFASQ